MTKFINNLNLYIDHYNIKKSFIIKCTGIEKNKFSRLLNGKQGILYEDMEAIAKVLDKEVSYFMQEHLELTAADYKETTLIGFYMGSPDEDKKELANQVFDFLEHVDAILGVRKKMEKDALEVLDYGI
jgi:transcriptional regulator with XRE-family HTH domain